MNRSRYIKALLATAFLCAAPHCRPAWQNIALADNAPVFDRRVTQLMGIYEAVPLSAKIPGQAAAGSPSLDDFPLTAAAAKKKHDASDGIKDPKDLCQVLGPFRLMARRDVKFEILRDAPNKVIMLFENRSWGNVRNLRLNAEFLSVRPGFRPLWNGDSIAHWDGDTLVVDSIHFTDKTWLNEAGITNSKQLQLTERFHLIQDGKYLAYRATARDPDVLTVPVSYIRYFQRTTRELVEYSCFEKTPGITTGRH